MINKKEGLFFVLVFLIIFESNLVFAGIGLTPARIYTDFNPGEKFLINFQVLDLGSSHELNVFAEGDFAEYVKFDKTHLKNGDYSFTAYVDLPEKAKKPGENMLSIQILEDTSDIPGISARLGVGARVYIKVPYPGTYAEVKSFDIPDSNSEEDIDILIDLENLGSNQIYARTTLDIFSDNKKLESFDLGTQFVDPNNSTTFKKIIEGGHYNPGFYNATVHLEYGGDKPIELDDSFRIGRLFIDITDWTKEFNISKINEFNIDIESKWNNDIKNVYAEVNITNSSGEVNIFKTPSVNIKRWEKITLQGFFNTEDVEAGKYKAKIILYYNGEVTEKEVKIKVVDGNGLFSSINKTVIVVGIIIIVFIIILFAGFIIMYYLLKRKLNKK